MPTVRHSRAVIGTDRESATRVIVRGHAVYNAMIPAKTVYVSPPISAATLLGQLQVTETAQQAVVARMPGAAAARKPKIKALYTSLQVLCTFVQSLADASPDQAEAIIEGSGFLQADASGHDKPILSAEPVQPDGSVHLVANGKALVGNRKGQHLYCWRFSTDGGRTWNDAPATPDTQTVLSGLPRLAVCSFCVAARNRKDQTEWSPIVTVLIP